MRPVRARNLMFGLALSLASLPAVHAAAYVRQYYDTT
jgi:hypothetical protein